MIEVSGVEQLELLAAGENVSVYSGVEVGSDSRVAVKVMRADLDGGERRFEQEKRLLRRLSSIDGVAPVRRTGVLYSGEPFLVMPLYERSVADLVSAGPMEASAAAELIARVASTLAAVHRLNIVHLAIKPSNVLIDSAGEAFVTDFAVGESSMVSAMSTQFAAPERSSDAKPTAAADVYSLGATLSALLTNGELASVVSSAMASDPAARPSMAAFANQLSAIRVGDTGPVDSQEEDTAADSFTADSFVVTSEEPVLEIYAPPPPQAAPPPPQAPISPFASDTLVGSLNSGGKAGLMVGLGFAAMGLFVSVVVLFFFSAVEDDPLQIDEAGELADPPVAVVEVVPTPAPEPLVESLPTTAGPEVAEDVATTAAPETAAPEAPAIEPFTMWDSLNASGEAIQFAVIGSALGIQEDLEALEDVEGNEVSRTLFAPSDSALGAFGAEAVSGLASDPNAAALLVGYHFLEEPLLAEDLVARDGETLTTRVDLPLEISVVDGQVVLNGIAVVTSTDFEADNGVVHIIDMVLTPPSAG